jgi:hypothetical protein
MSVGAHVSTLYPHEKYHSPSVKKRLTGDGEADTVVAACGLTAGTGNAFGSSAAQSLPEDNIITSAVSKQYVEQICFIVVSLSLSYFMKMFLTITGIFNTFACFYVFVIN